MTADALKKITTDALDTLAALLDEGHSDQLTALLKTMARFHKYSWHNVCLIASQRPTATRVAGFQTWRTMGRFVRKGEKGIAILAPIVGRREAESDERQRANRPWASARRTCSTSSRPTASRLPSLAKPQAIPAQRRPRSRRRSSNRALRSNPSTTLAAHLARQAADAFGSSTVSRPPWSSRPSFTNTRTNCLHRADDRPASRDTRELEAEAVAFVVGGAVGLNTSDASRDYILLYRGDREALSGSLDRIQRAASVILKAVSVGG